MSNINLDIARMEQINNFLVENYGRGIVWRLQNCRVYVAVPRLFGAGAILLCEPIVEVGVAEEWMYESALGAKSALSSWKPGEVDEPQGWVRHKPSNRRREHGDATKETVRA